MLASAGIQKNKDGQNPKQTDNPSSDSCSTFPSTSKSKIVSELASNQYKRTLDDGVETFLDEMGRLRVSRVRAMGIRMTRDLQRNLDLMKELEQGQTSSFPETGRLMRNKNLSEFSHGGNGKSIDLPEKNEPSMFVKESSIQISFEDDGEMKSPDDDEEVFARLVAGNSSTLSCADKFPSVRENTASDIDWEEGKVDSFSQEGEVETKTVLDRGCDDDETEVEWEEEFYTSPDENIFCTEVSSNKSASKGSLEEYAELQEAIRRSLQDEKYNLAPNKDEKQQIHGVHGHEHDTFCASQKTVDEQLTLSEDITKLDSEVKDGAVKCKSADETFVLQRDKTDISEGASVQLSKQGAGENGDLLKNECLSESMLPLEPNLDAENLLSISSGGDKSPVSAKGPVRSTGGMSCQISSAMHKNEAAVLSYLTTERTILEAQLLESSVSGNDVSCEQIAGDNYRDDLSGELQNLEKFVVETNKDVEVDITKSSLEEEMQKLNQECAELGNEQKKFERNAESVSSEIFTECQVLLHSLPPFEESTCLLELIECSTDDLYTVRGLSVQLLPCLPGSLFPVTSAQCIKFAKYRTVVSSCNLLLWMETVAQLIRFIECQMNNN